MAPVRLAAAAPGFAQAAALRQLEGATINVDQPLSGPPRGHSIPSPQTTLKSPDAAGASGKTPRRPGTRGGKGRSKPAAVPAPAGEGTTPGTKPRRRGSRGGRGGRGRGRKTTKTAEATSTTTDSALEPLAAQPPLAETPQAEATPVSETFEPVTDPRASSAPEEIDERALPSPPPEVLGDQQPPRDAAAPATPSPFVPGPPRVGMRPAVIRPAPAGGRMSFSKGGTRQHFRPGGFRPGRAFTPPADAAPPPAAEQQPTPTPQPQPRPPAPQHPQHRGPQHAGHRGPQQPQQQRGRDQRHDNRQQQHGHHAKPFPQQHRAPQRALPPAPPPVPVPVEPVQETADLVPLEPTQATELPLQTTPAALQPPTTADAAALAPFAEDIEIDETAIQQAPRRPPTGRDMLINVVEGEEVRIAVIKRGVLEELYMERSSTESHIGNIYKGRVTNVEPSIQAAFIDFGIGKNGFLHISDLHPQYFPKRKQPRMPMPRRTPPRQPAPAAIPAPVTPAETPAENGGGTFAHEQAADFPAMHIEEIAATPAPSADSSAPDALMDSTSEMTADATAGEVPANDQPDAAVPSEENAPAVAEAGTESTDEATADDTADTADEAPAPADFGSAYRAEFSEDDEFVDDYESDDLDDGHMKPMEKVGRKTPRRERPPIQQCLRRGQEVIVQVTKEGIGTKGPTLTSYISCPGRYLVMMPGMAQLGVSRKIEDLDQRRELKRTLQELNPPKNLGFIIRTAGTEVAKKELQGDLNYLVRMWKVIANRIRTHKAPVELYEESDLVIRTIRDVFSDQIDRIIVDNEQVASRVRDFLSIVDPRAAGMVELYTGTMPLYQKFGVEREIEKINSRRVEMANGGSLVIDSTEALVAIDVNSGRYREMRDAELTAFNMNKEALKEVVRQLRLRDLGGVIVIDFIDMREERHKREIENLLRKEMENDRAKTKVLRMSQFCMIEMTRQRVRPSLKRSIYMDCPHCHGSALIKTPESVSLDVMRRLAAGATRNDVARLEVKAYPTVATFLLNRKRKALVELEDKTGKRIAINSDDKLAGDQIVIQPFDGRGILMNLVI